MNIEVYNTHIELYPYTNGDLPALEDMYTAEDYRTKEKVPCGYIIDNGKIYVPRGTSVSKLEMMTGTEAEYIDDSDPSSKMKRSHHALYEPRNEVQSQSIDFLIRGEGRQLALNLATGVGKTFCVAHAITQLGIKALIITHSDSIKLQWIKTFKDMMDFRSSDLCNITGSNVMEGLMTDHIDPADVYFINHQTLRNFLFTHGAVEFHNFFKHLKIGIKAYDESHLNFGNILMIDSFSNTNATWYISATFDRSDKSESACFRKAFQSVIPFGEEESKALTKKHIEYFTVNIHSHPTQPQIRKVVPFQGMSAATYGRYAFLDDKNETAYNAIKMILEKIKDIDGKILIFIPLIDAVDEVTAKLKKDFDNKSVAAYHSRVSRDEKENATEKDIIVSTIKSCGTGRDIPGLKAIICAEPIASKVQTQQLLGRIRPIQNGEVPTYFFDVVDRAFAPINWWWKSRMKKIQVIAKSVSNLQLE